MQPGQPHIGDRHIKTDVRAHQPRKPGNRAGRHDAAKKAQQHRIAEADCLRRAGRAARRQHHRRARRQLRTRRHMPAHRHGGVAEARYAFSVRPGCPTRQIIQGRCRVDDEPRPQCLDLGPRLCRRLLLAERQQCATKPVGSDLRRQKKDTVPRRRAGGHPKRDDLAMCGAVCLKHRRHACATSGRVRGTWPRQSGIPAPSHLASAPPRHRTGQADRRGHLAMRRARPPNARPRPRPGRAVAGCRDRLSRPARPAGSARYPIGRRAAAGRSQARAFKCAFLVTEGRSAASPALCRNSR